MAVNWFQISLQKIKNMSAWRYLAYLMLPALAVCGFYIGGIGNYMVPVACFIARPLLSLLPGKGNHLVSAKVIPQNHHYFHTVILVYVPVLLLVTFWALFQVASSGLPAFSWVGFCLSIGIINGIIGFTLGHEFIHRNNTIDQLAGHLLLWQNNYLHYSIEHISGHHTYACTPKDPHTARFNESFYQFLPRAISGTFLNAWELEGKRLAKVKMPKISFHNRVLKFLLIQILTLAVLYFFGRGNVVLFFLLQASVAIVLLHIINYLQHYGLLRRQLPGGKFEKLQLHHAWNSNISPNDLSLFQLENHADHHVHPNRSFEQLSHHDDSPEHPLGYTGMIWLALFPPLWFRTMNPKIDPLSYQTE